MCHCLLLMLCCRLNAMKLEHVSVFAVDAVLHAECNEIGTCVSVCC
jgi:hypothetical protein